MDFCLDSGARQPERAHPYDAGLDLFISKFTHNDSAKFHGLEPRETLVLDTGVHLAIPSACVGLVLPRSSVSSRGILTHTGVIDSGYIGSIKVVVTNVSDFPVKLKLGQKIAQLVIQPVLIANLIQVSELDNTIRGVNGFGSTGN